MSYEAGMIVDAIVDDVCDELVYNDDDPEIVAIRERIENRISAFESELIAQTRSVLIEAVKGAQV
jgi:hypothetical protein